MALAPVDKSFEATQRLEDGVRIIEGRGELDLSSVGRIERLVGPTVDQGRGLILDLTACPFIDSSGIRFVLETHRALTGNGRVPNPMVVVASREVERMLVLTAIDQTVPVLASLKEAKALFSLGTRAV